MAALRLLRAAVALCLLAGAAFAAPAGLSTRPACPMQAEAMPMPCCDDSQDGPAGPAPCCRITRPAPSSPALLTATPMPPALVVAALPAVDPLLPPAAPRARRADAPPCARSAPLFLATAALLI